MCRSWSDCARWGRSALDPNPGVLRIVRFLREGFGRGPSIGHPLRPVIVLSGLRGGRAGDWRAQSPESSNSDKSVEKNTCSSQVDHGCLG